MSLITIDKTLLGIICTIMAWMFIGLVIEAAGMQKARREARKLLKSIKDRKGKL